MHGLLLAIYSYFLHPLLSLLVIVLFVYFVLSWLIVFGVVQPHNQTVRGIMGFLDSIVRPLQRPIQRIVPRMGQLDLSLMILILLIYFVRDWLLPQLISLVPF